ncbi:MAG: UvrD-helicase domain-containing protein, partial [Oscillospiraceae bacterium]|nr:UvrD-helicase domain-containing protein [Oscillospiraceae bacterium]
MSGAAVFAPTNQQRDAIGLRGGALLVSAAAGSGKTRVLVERLLAYVTDPEEEYNIDDFLVITYTRAAAGELRSRIQGELALRRSREPDNARLRRQATLCYRAPISTIHSFCAELLRENAHRLGLAPDFRVADETECTLLKAQALDDLFDSRCDNVSDGAESGFALLADMFFTGRGDRRLRDIVLDVYSRLQSHPYPDRWVAAQLDRINFGNVSDAAETVWGEAVMDDARRAARHWLGVMR